MHPLYFPKKFTPHSRRVARPQAAIYTPAMHDSKSSTRTHIAFSNDISAAKPHDNSHTHLPTIKTAATNTEKYC
jgi:hypothetical protein